MRISVRCAIIYYDNNNNNKIRESEKREREKKKQGVTRIPLHHAHISTDSRTEPLSYCVLHTGR